MADRLTPERRSWNMSRIGHRDTKPELIVRSLLHRLGYRFRLHRKDLPGKPDITLAKYKTVIFVHGCFWHRHPRCKYSYTPRTRKEFWKEKFERNIKRDKRVGKLLRSQGWKVRIIWECETFDQGKLVERVKSLFSKPLSRP